MRTYTNLYVYFIFVYVIYFYTIVCLYVQLDLYTLGKLLCTYIFMYLFIDISFTPFDNLINVKTVFKL